MTFAKQSDDLAYRAACLPRETFLRSIFDNLLVRLSDKGGASRLIGAAWSEAAAAELETWVGSAPMPVRGEAADLTVTAVYRLDTLPGIAARASRRGLKNPDFLVQAEGTGGPVVMGVDAKFSVETAKSTQVSAAAIARLYEEEAGLADVLPALAPDVSFADGLFVSPDYNVTHAMFARQVGHRRLSVSRDEVVLVPAEGGEPLRHVADEALFERLVRIDRTGIPVWGSLLATQYYFRLACAIVGLIEEEDQPLLGDAGPGMPAAPVSGRVDARARSVESAWQLIARWNRDVEHIRQQRQALQQVVGVPLSGAELRMRSDAIMDALELEARPSRNRIRKEVGRRFTGDVLERTGVIMPPVADFPAELERVAAVARDVAGHYAGEMDTILTGIIRELACGPGANGA